MKYEKETRDILIAMNESIIDDMVKKCKNAISDAVESRLCTCNVDIDMIDFKSSPDILTNCYNKIITEEIIRRLKQEELSVNLLPTTCSIYTFHISIYG